MTVGGKCVEKASSFVFFFGVLQIYQGKFARFFKKCQKSVKSVKKENKLKYEKEKNRRKEKKRMC